ncbi:MAG: response regulator [Lachnospiraceae bacterium]|nr:response regulator [Lachnospiraceae bacterium]
MIKVLLVDDEPHIVQGLKAIIDWDQEGFEIVRSCSNGKEAFDYLKDNKVDMIVADIKMPVMNGLELLKKLREENLSEAYFIILSGYADFSFAQQAIKYECSDYLLKPVDGGSLLEVVKKVQALSFEKNQQIDRTKKMEDAYFTQNIIPIIHGKFDEINVEYVNKHLRMSDNMRYIELQLTEKADEDEQTDSEKRSLQRKLYETVSDYLGEDEKCCIFDPSGYDKIFDVGIVFFDYMCQERNIDEIEYLKKLISYVTSLMECRISVFAGKRVKGISNLSKSYGTACKLRFLQGFRDHKDLCIYEDETRLPQEGVVLCKDSLDSFIRAIEENNRKEIIKNVDAVFDELESSKENESSMNLNINYLLFQLINLASEQDSEINQEEILRLISENTFEEGIRRGSRAHILKFAFEYADYLQQLRKNVSRGTLADIEKEVRKNYMNNLTLKELGDKYYVNSAYLGQLFHKKYGCSFKDYLNNYRIEQAVSLLLKNDMKTYEIAEAVGYKDVDYFVNKFIAVKGCTPAKFKKMSEV